MTNFQESVRIPWPRENIRNLQEVLLEKADGSRILNLTEKHMTLDYETTCQGIFYLFMPNLVIPI